MALDRTAYNALVDDSGSGTDGTILTKALLASVILDPVDAMLINLTNRVTGRLPFANLVAASAAARLLGRRSGSAGDVEELSLGASLELTSNTVLGITNPLTLPGALTLSAGQLVFPASQNPSSNVNTLDDYEEGTWTPVIGGGGGTSGQTYSVQSGTYVKIGKLVHVQCYVNLTAKGTITGALQLQGLPFVSDGTSNGFAMGIVEWSLATSWVNVVARVGAGASVATLEGATVAAASNLTGMTTTDVNDSSRLMLTMTYRAGA
jgi:hypothetical protein